MAGLLDGFGDFIKTPEGQGLLSAVMGGMAGARQGTPWNNMGRAGMAGVMGYGGALDRQAQASEAEQMKKYRDMQQQQMQMQINDAKKKAADAEALRALQKQFTIPAKPENAGGLPSSFNSALPAEFQTGVNVSPMAAQPATFNREGFGKAWETIDPIAGFNYQQSLVKDDAPQVVAPGGALISGRASGYKPLYVNPKEDSTDPKVKQFEYAKAGGYKGSFEQFVTLGPTIMAGAAAPLRNAQIGNIEAENAYNLPPPRPAAKPNAPMRGQVVDGYKFRGGNPADQRNWEKQ
jgi:hypothetical protein